MKYKISHPTKNVNCDINLPASKSISNRLLIIQALSKKKFKISNLSSCDDTKNLSKAIKLSQNTIDAGHGGSTFRFLTALLCLQHNKESVLTGSSRIKKRPIRVLVEALRELGAKIEYLEKEGFPPLRILGTKLNGGYVKINGEISSQFISALLMIAPALNKGIKLKITGKLVSESYIRMTLRLMSEFNIIWTWIDNVITIKKQDYITKNYTVESDWSSASFWFQIAALSRTCDIRLKGLRKDSIQGDIKIMEIFSKLGVESSFKNKILILKRKKRSAFYKKIDLIETPDLYQPLRCTIFAKKIKTEIIGTQTLKYKESDRTNAVETELTRLNSNRIIKTYQDHRMAMSFAPLCLKIEEVIINDIEVVSKSYPKFWDDLSKGGFIISPLSD